MRTSLLPLLAAACSPVFAQTTAPATPSTLDKIWSAATVYKGEGAVNAHQPPGVTLRHRALPFMQMLKSCQQLGDDVVWGV